jgi:hypothetical protein
MSTLSPHIRNPQATEVNSDRCNEPIKKAMSATIAINLSRDLSAVGVIACTTSKYCTYSLLPSIPLLMLAT